MLNRVLSVVGILCLCFVFGTGYYTVNAAEIAAVACAGSGELVFVSLAQAQVIKKIKLGITMPFRLAVTPDQKTVVVVGPYGALAFVDVDTMAVIGTLSLLAGPEAYGVTQQPNHFEDVAITPDGMTAVVAESNELGQLFFIDIATMTISSPSIYLGDEPLWVVVNSAGNLALVLDDGSLHLVELHPPSLDDTIDLGIDEIGGMAFTPDESQAIFTDFDNHVYLLSTATWTTLDTLTLDPNHFMESVDVSISPSGNLAIVANGTDQSISFVGVSGTQLTRVGLLPIQGVPHQTAFNADGSIAAVTVLSANRLHLINVASQTITTTIEEGMGLGPAGVAIITVAIEPTPEALSAADLDEDGDVDAVDLQHFAGSYGQ